MKAIPCPAWEDRKSAWIVALEDWVCTSLHCSYVKKWLKNEHSCKKLGLKWMNMNMFKHLLGTFLYCVALSTYKDQLIIIFMFLEPGRLYCVDSSLCSHLLVSSWCGPLKEICWHEGFVSFPWLFEIPLTLFFWVSPAAMQTVCLKHHRRSFPPQVTGFWSVRLMAWPLSRGSTTPSQTLNVWRDSTSLRGQGPHPTPGMMKLSAPPFIQRYPLWRMER